MNKICIKCGISKPLIDFYALKETVDGTRNVCKICFGINKKVWAESRYHLVRDKILLYQKQASKIYHQTEKGKLVKKAAAHKRRILESTINTEVVQQVYEDNIKKFSTLTCELCFGFVKFGEDCLEHFHPISRASEYNGDVNERKNLGVAHNVKSVENCNSRKGNKTLEEYNEYIKRAVS